MDNSENNKLIAGFMGFTKEENIGWYDNEMLMPQIVYDTQDGNCFDDLLFNQSFDWLMPVVEKIESLGFRRSIVGNEYYNMYEFYDNSERYLKINIKSQIHRFKGYSNEEQENSSSNHLTAFEATHQSIIEFITWYNYKQQLNG